MCQKYPSGLHDVLVEALALLSAFVLLPAMDGAFVETEGRNDSLRRAVICQHAVTTVATSSCGLCIR